VKSFSLEMSLIALDCGLRDCDTVQSFKIRGYRGSEGRITSVLDVIPIVVRTSNLTCFINDLSVITSLVFLRYSDEEHTDVSLCFIQCVGTCASYTNCCRCRTVF
jgi:hypothetical protein